MTEFGNETDFLSRSSPSRPGREAASAGGARRLSPGGHGRGPRHDAVPPLGRAVPAGRFGRMVPELTNPLVVEDAALVALGLAMDEKHGGKTGDNANIPAGYTYLGQFIDHDITLDTTTLSEIDMDPLGVENFRTPRLDLDSVYGLGPRVQPSLYEQNPRRLNTGTAARAARLLLGRTSVGGAEAAFGDLPHDLPRNAEGFALIGDERNDENLLVAQTHVAFLRFHNAIAERLAAQGTNDLFKAARRATIHLYQAMVLRDFLTKICDPNDIAAAVDQRQFFRFETFGAFGQPYMPVEFSVAAYRLGHSMVREVYNHNRIFRPGGAVPASLRLLFDFTAKSGQIGLPSGGPAAKPTLAGDWIIDWRRYLDFETTDTEGGFGLNQSRLIDPYLVEELHRLGLADGEKPNPDGRNSLAVMNLRRGVKMQLPAAQDLARFMKVDVLRPDQIGDDTPDGRAARAGGMLERTPLWYYILKEAGVVQGGDRLGPLGSRIVAETFVGLLDGDDESILGRNPMWRFGDPLPGLVLPGAEAQFSYADLIAVAAGGRDKAALSPIG